MDIKTLVKVTSRAWSLSILALMHDGTPGRQVALISASGAGRTAFAHSLAHLLDLALLERNPGHGHPLRPEFRLTKKGEKAAIVASKIQKAACKPGEPALVRRAWTVPVLVASQNPRKFTDISKELVSITDRALSQTLKLLLAQEWLLRDIDMDIRPPRPMYQATRTGALISQAVSLQDLCHRRLPRLPSFL